MGPLALPGLVETAWFQRRVSGLAGAQGVALAWSSLDCAWVAGRCTWRDLVVEADGLRASLGTLTAGWAWRPLLDSRLVLKTLEAREVEVARVGPARPTSGEAAPPSHALEALATLPAVQLKRLDIDALSVRWPVGDRWLELEKLRLTGGAQVGPGVAPSVALTLGGGQARVLDGAQVVLELEAMLDARAVVEGRRLTLTTTSQVTHSEPAWPMMDRRALELDAQLDFAPAEGRIDVALRRLSALGEAVTGRARLALPDEGAPGLGELDLHAVAEPLRPLLQRLEPTLELADATLSVASPAQEPGVLEAQLRARRLAARGHEAREVRLNARTRPLVARPKDEALGREAGPEDVAASRANAVGGPVAVEAQLELGALSSDVLRASGITLGADGTLEGGVLDLVAQLGARALSTGPARVEGAAARLELRRFDAKALRGALGLTLDARAVDIAGEARTHLDASRLALEATLAEQAVLKLTGTPGRARVTHEAGVLEAVPAPLSVEATLDARWRLVSANASLPLREVRLRRDDGALRVGRVAHTLAVEGDPREAAALRFSFDLSAVEAARGAHALTVSSLELGGDARVTPGGLERLRSTVRHSGLQAGELRTAGGALEVALDAPPGDALTASLDGALPPLTVHAKAQRRGRGLRASVRADASSLGVLRPLWPAELGGGLSIDPHALGFSLDGAVELADLARPTELSADLKLSLPRLEAQLGARRLEANALSLALVHRHAERLDRGTLQLRLAQPSVEDVRLDGVAEAKLAFSLDRARGVGALKATLDTKAERTLAADLSLRRERDGRLHHELELDVAHLGPWAPLVNALSTVPPGVVLDQLAAHLVSRGDTLGLLDADFQPVPEWRAQSDTTFHAGLELQHVLHRVDREETKAPRVSVAIDAGVLHGAVHLTAKLEVPTLELDVGTQHVALTGVHQVLTLRSETDPDAGLMQVELDGVIDELDQNLWPPWQPSAVHLAVDGSVDRLAALTIERLLLESPSAGTRLELSKRLRAESEDARDAAGQRFRLDGTLTQDLARLDGAPRAFTGAGTVKVGLRVQSADLSLFRVRGKLELTDAGVALPAQQLVVDGATGEVPFEEAFTLDAAKGAQLVLATERAAFARARGQEAQPLRRGDGSLSVRRLRWKDVELAPVVASLELEQNRFSLSRFKAERGSARVSGQLFIDYRPGEEVVTFRGTLTGLQRKGAGTPLDANAAFTFVPRRLELDGRVQVVRTSKEHLLDLLDVLDPHKEVGSLNQVRSAMAFGYPKEAQLDFGDGLLSMDIAFGGLAGLFELGTVRGVSLGPFLNRYLAPSLRSSP